MEHSFLNFTFFSEDIDTYFRRLLLGYISLTGKLFLPKKINNFNEFCYIKLIVCCFSWRLNNSAELSASSMQALVLKRTAFKWVNDFSWRWNLLFRLSFNKTLYETMLFFLNQSGMRDHYKKLHKFCKDIHILQDYNRTRYTAQHISAHRTICCCFLWHLGWLDLLLLIGLLDFGQSRDQLHHHHFLDIPLYPSLRLIILRNIFCLTLIFTGVIILCLLFIFNRHKLNNYQYIYFHKLFPNSER